MNSCEVVFWILAFGMLGLSYITSYLLKENLKLSLRLEDLETGFIKVNDEILELNIQIHNLVFCIGQKERDELPDIRDLKDKEDEYEAWSDLFDLKEKLEEADDLIDKLRFNYEYD